MDPTVSTNPSEITVSRTKREVFIRWQDGHESAYGFDTLRKDCPCAVCNDERSKRDVTSGLGLTVVSGPILKAGEIQVTEVKPVGRYAINFVWSDGHDSGIYTFNSLRALCPCPSCRASRQASGDPRLNR